MANHTTRRTSSKSPTPAPQQNTNNTNTNNLTRPVDSVFKERLNLLLGTITVCDMLKDIYLAAITSVGDKHVLLASLPAFVPPSMANVDVWKLMQVWELPGCTGRRTLRSEDGVGRAIPLPPKFCPVEQRVRTVTLAIGQVPYKATQTTVMALLLELLDLPSFESLAEAVVALRPEHRKGGGRRSGGGKGGATPTAAAVPQNSGLWFVEFNREHPSTESFVDLLLAMNKRAIFSGANDVVFFQPTPSSSSSCASEALQEWVASRDALACKVMSECPNEALIAQSVGPHWQTSKSPVGLGALSIDRSISRRASTPIPTPDASTSTFYGDALSASAVDDAFDFQGNFLSSVAPPAPLLMMDGSSSLSAPVSPPPGPAAPLLFDFRLL